MFDLAFIHNKMVYSLANNAEETHSRVKLFQIECLAWGYYKDLVDLQELGV